MRKLLTIQEFIQKAKAIHGNKYDYSKVDYIDNQTKVIIICPEHGEFKQRPNSHLQGSTCYICSKKKLSNLLISNKEEFIEKARKVHGNKYDYSNVAYINARTKVTIICPEHGEFEQLPNNHLQGNGCYKCFNKKRKYTKDQFIQKAKAIHGNKYDYNRVNYIDSKTKVTIICPEHGEFEQTPANHLSNTGCPICSNKYIGNLLRSNTEEFIEKAKAIHGDKYDYSKVAYINARTKVTIFCNKKNHKEFIQLPSVHLLGVGCPICNSSKGELAIKVILDKYGIDAKQEWKFPDEKYRYEYDFYLPEYNLLIEFHGKQHYEYIQHFHKTIKRYKKQKERDTYKKWLAELKKVTLIEFNYRQFELTTKEQFEELIMNKLNLCIKDTEKEQNAK